jgi:nickel/cobalt exporter
MPDLAALLQQDASNAWLFIPTAILLGALHGLEPGHSKTMMAAFIVAVRGTVGQAVLLGLSATASHTLVVWAVALGGLYFGRNFSAADEPYFQLASGLAIMAVAGWMLWRLTATTAKAGRDHHDHGHDHHHDHDHPHDHDHGHSHAGALLALEDGAAGDAHQQAHAAEIERRFAGRHVTTGQIVMFGITGGLIPCPAAITVLLLCLQLKQVAAGATLVLCFSIGLALTMVAAGVVAAMGARHASRRWAGFDTFLRRAPYASGLLILGLGGYLAIRASGAIWG